MWEWVRLGDATGERDSTQERDRQHIGALEGPCCPVGPDGGNGGGGGGGTPVVYGESYS